MCIGTYDEIGTKLIERYRGVVTDIEFSIAVQTEQDRETLRGLAAMIQREDDNAARAAIVGYTGSSA